MRIIPKTNEKFYVKKARGLFLVKNRRKVKKVLDKPNERC